MIDSHAHLDFYSRKKLVQVIENAKKDGIKAIIANSVNLVSCKKSLDIAKGFDIVHLAAGLYPEKDLSISKYGEFEKWFRENSKKIVALGEIGLDFSEGVDPEIQEKVFVKELELAREFNVPVIIHSRKAEARTLEIIEDFKDLKIILHFFSGNFKLVRKAVELGCYFSVPTNIVRSEHFQKLVQEVPRNRILTETDAPYVSPFPGKDNESAFISESIKMISLLWKIKVEEVEDIIDKNFFSIFKKKAI